MDESAEGSNPFLDKTVRHDVRGGLWGISLSITALEIETDAAERLLLVDGIIDAAEACLKVIDEFVQTHPAGSESQG